MFSVNDFTVYLSVVCPLYRRYLKTNVFKFELSLPTTGGCGEVLRFETSRKRLCGIDSWWSYIIKNFRESKLTCKRVEIEKTPTRICLIKLKCYPGKTGL